MPRDRKKTLLPEQLQPGDAVRHYRIKSKLGAGGMGVVYAARDERLERDVAIKMIRNESGDRSLRDRLWREARSAARVTHPNVCHVYEIEEESGALYVAMELLEGESLADRLGSGPLELREALRVTIGILEPLDALHRKDIVHRDLKPSNVFLTTHGVKLLDFGLAHSLSGPADDTQLAITQPGMVIGSPRYMSPERWTGGAIGQSTDLFSVGAMLFEMLSGRPAFRGTTIHEIYHAVVHDQPPALAGGPDVLAADRIIQRALGKRPIDRYRDAAAMIADLRTALDEGPTQATAIETTTRLIVLPFRMLRPDPEIDFLAYSLPDAIVASLSAVESIVVRSSATAARFAGPDLDTRTIATEAGVDAVVRGTLLRSGDRVRVTTELIEAASATVRNSKTAEGSTDDIFRLQDELVDEIVASLEIPGAGSRRRVHEVRPATAKAYELYLRANEIGRDRLRLAQARELYEACLAEDANFAPAWAQLGRIHRVMAKHEQGGGHREMYESAETAFRRALDISPDDSIAHNLYTYLEVESLGRSREAMTRLLGRARQRTTDPQLFAGLVHACRFCGLLDASVAADRRARRLDPAISTSVQYTYVLQADYESAIAIEDASNLNFRSYLLYRMGRVEDSIALFEEGLKSGRGTDFDVEIVAMLRGEAHQMERALEGVVGSGFTDPEGFYFIAMFLARGGVNDAALSFLERAVRSGFHCHASLMNDPWFDGLRGEPRFAEIARHAQEGHWLAAEAYRLNGGPQLLGVSSTT